MTTQITCDEFLDQLSALLEGDADESTRAALEAHALGCPDCGALLADLRRMRIDAANLPALAPERDLWAGIAARIETPVYELPSTGEHPVAAPRRGNARRFDRVWLGVAAAGLVAVTALLTRAVVMRSAAPVAVRSVAAAQPVFHDTGVSSATPAATVAAGQSSTTTKAGAPRATLAASHAARPSAEVTYDAEIRGLRAVLAARRPYLDSTTVAVVEHNLAVIDTAIAQCRSALRKDPASRFLLESLDDALDTKVQLLRTAAMLPNRRS